MLTIALVLLITLYMLLSPTKWVRHTMQLSKMTWDYEIFLLGLGLVYFVLSWIYEKHIAVRLGKVLGILRERLTGHPKQRKEYKLILDSMRT